MFNNKLFVFIILCFHLFKLNFGSNSSEVNNLTQNLLENIAIEDGSKEYSFLITGGYRPVRPTLTKHVVSLRLGKHRYFGANHLCAGSIISPKIILTAAHCLCESDTRIRLKPHQITVVAGTPKRLVATNKTQICKVRKLIRHRYYNPNTMRNDIGIVVLSSSIVEDNQSAQRIAVANEKPAPNTQCSVLGWGRVLSHGPMPNEALYVNLTIFEEKKCASFFRSFAYGMLCAGDRKDYTKGACNGDSGGPLICNNILTGIVSFGARGVCTGKAPGFYTDVSSFKKWIRENDSNKLSANVTSLQAIFIVILLNYL